MDVDDKRVLREVWITSGGQHMHTRRDCELLLSGQERALQTGAGVIHPPELWPAHMAWRIFGWGGKRRENCSHCWSADMVRSQADEPETVAAFNARAEAAQPRADKDRAARKATNQIAERHGLSSAQAEVVQFLVRENWLGDRPPGQDRLTEQEVVDAARDATCELA